MLNESLTNSSGTIPSTEHSSFFYRYRRRTWLSSVQSGPCLRLCMATHNAQGLECEDDEWCSCRHMLELCFLFFCILNLITIHLLSSLCCPALFYYLCYLRLMFEAWSLLITERPFWSAFPEGHIRLQRHAVVRVLVQFSSSPLLTFLPPQHSLLRFFLYKRSSLTHICWSLWTWPYTLPSDAFVHLICASADSNIIYPIIIIPPALHLTLHHAFTFFRTQSLASPRTALIKLFRRVIYGPLSVLHL